MSMRLIDADALIKDMVECCSPTQFGRATAKMCVKRAPTISPAANWTPCSVALPESENTWVFATVEYDERYLLVEKVMFHNKNCKTWCDSRGNQIRNDKILAWRPLPAPWSGEKGATE